MFDTDSHTLSNLDKLFICDALALDFHEAFCHQINVLLQVKHCGRMFAMLDQSVMFKQNNFHCVRADILTYFYLLTH